GWRVVAEKTVEPVEEVGRKVDRDERGEREPEGAEELPRQVAAHHREEEASCAGQEASAPSRANSRPRSIARWSWRRSRCSSVRSRPACTKRYIPPAANTAFGSQSPMTTGTTLCSASACPNDSIT